MGTRAPVHVLPIYVDVSRFRNIKRQPHTQKTILWFGRFEPEKDPLLAIKILEQIRRTIAAKLIMLGAGSLEKSLKTQVIPISAVSGEGLDTLLGKLARLLQQYPRPLPPEAPDKERKIIRPHHHADTRQYKIAKEKGGWRVTGKRIEQIVAMTHLENEEAVARVYDVLDRVRVLAKLAAAGAKPGDSILIGKNKLEYYPPD